MYRSLVDCLYPLFLLITLSASPFCLANDLAYAANSDSDNVSVIDTSSQSVVNTVFVRSMPVSVAIAPAPLHPKSLQGTRKTMISEFYMSGFNILKWHVNSSFGRTAKANCKYLYGCEF